jgi:hypothetical protein
MSFGPMPRLLIVLLLAANAFAGAHELAPAPLLVQPIAPGQLSAAHAGGRFLTVWKAATGTWEQNVYGVLSDADGRRISPAAFLLGESSQKALQVVGTGDSFALFWTNRTGLLQLTDVGLDGQVLRTRSTGVAGGLDMSVAWDGERFLVATFRESYYANGGAATLLARNGTVLHETIPLERPTTASSVAATADGFLVFTGSPHDFFANRITREGGITRVAAGDAPQQIASTTLAGGAVLAVATTFDGTMRSQLWKDGAKVHEQIIATQHLGGILPIHLMPGDGRHLLAIANTRKSTIMTMHLGDDGTPLDEPRTVDDTLPYPLPPGASNGEVLFVPRMWSSPDGSLIASLALDREGGAGIRDVLSIRPAPQSDAIIGAGGGAMLTAWTERTGTGTQVRTAMIGRDFEPRNVRVLAASGSLISRNLPWNGTEYLAVHQHGGDLFASRLGYDGTPLGEAVFLGRVSFPAVSATWAGDRWAIVWPDPSGRVSYATVMGGLASLPLTLTANPVGSVAVAFDGRRVHLAWCDASAVFTTRLRPDGRIVDETPLPIPAANPTTVRIVAGNGRVVVLVDAFPDTSIHVVDAKTRQLLSSRTLVQRVASSDLAWSGYEFVAASAFDRTLAVWHLGRDGTATNEPRLTETLSRFDLRVSVASSPSYDTVVAMQGTDAASGPRAVIYPSREFPPTIP